MGLGDFWLQSHNGKKYSLKDLKDIKPEDIAKNPKLQKFIKLFDLDGSGNIEIKNKDGQNEWKSIFTELQQASVDNNLSREEFGSYISQKLPDEDIQLEDVNELFDIASREAEQTTQKQVGNKTITTTNGKVTQIVTDLGNGQTETTLYEYVETTENSAAHVVLTTIKGKGHISLTKVIDVDENGDYEDNQFIYRQTRTVEDGEPVLITIGKNQNGQLLEQKNKADKTIVNIYNTNDIKEFDNNHVNKLFQQVKYDADQVYKAFYDGKGNTYIPIKNGESINLFLQRVNKELKKLGKKELTINDIKKLNPKVDLNHLKVANPHSGDTGMLLITGTFNADSSLVYKSGTVEQQAQAQANDAMRKAAERVNNKNFKNHTLTKTYTSFEALAKELGVDVLELMTLNQSSTSANGLVALTKGATVRVPVELTSSDTPEMIKRAFPLNAQNRIFYQRYNSLNETQKRNVLNVVRSMQGKSAKEIKDTILNIYPDINLFDSGLTVPINNGEKLRSMPAYQTQGKSNIVSLETFITDYLKLDLRSQKGQIVYKRLLEAVQSNPIANMGSMSLGVQTKPATTDEEKYLQAVQANLNQLSASDFQDCSKMEAHQILELLFNAGIPRIRQEAQIRQSQLERNPMYQQKKREEFAADVLYNMMKQASDILHEYYSNIGYLSGDAMWQGLKNIANYATFGNVETIWKEMDKLDAMVARAEKLKHTPNHVEFEKLFKEFTNGFAFDNDKMQNLIDVTMKVAKGELADDSTEYINAFKGAFGSNVNLDIVADTQKSVSGQQTKGSICDIVMMLTALGNIGKLAKAKQFTQWALKALGKYGGSALVGATNLAGWTAVQKGTNLLTREADVTSEDLKEYGWEIVQSGGFGAAGSVWGNLAVSRVMGWTDKVVDKGLQKYLPKVVEKHMAKVATKVGDLFKASSKTATATAKNGVDVMTVAAKTPGYVAQGTGFLTEVAGFTGYQTIVDTAVSMIQQGGVGIKSIQNILVQKAQMKGELTEEKLVEIKNMSYTEAMLNLLAEEGGEQLQSLGTIKGVEAAMKFIMSGRIGMVPNAASFENCKTLKGMEIKPTSVDGKQFYEITMPNGKKMVANNEHDLISFCNQQMQIDILTNMVTEKLKKEGVEVSGVALVKTMGADRATVRTAREGQRTSNLQVKPINVDGQVKYEITDADGNIKTVDNVIDVINTTQSALAIDKIESTLNKQLKSGQSVSAKSLLKLVMSNDAEPVTINGVEIKPNEVLENSTALENLKISKENVDGKDVYIVTMENGRKVQVNSLENVIGICESQFKFEMIGKVVESETADLSRDFRLGSLEGTGIAKESLEAKINELPEGEFKDYVDNWKNRAEGFMAGMIYPKLDKLIDVYEKALRSIENVKDESIKQQAMDMVSESIRSGDMTAAIDRLSNIDKYIRIRTLTPSERFMSYLKNVHPEIYAEVQKNPDKINNPKYKEIKNDFLKLQKYENIIAECRAKAGTAEANTLYEQYLNEEIVSDNAKIDARIKDLCRQINKDFGVKVFLPSNLKEAGVGLKLVYQQLARYQMHAKAHGETANMPATLDFYRSEINFVKSSDVAGEYKAGSNSMSVNGLTIDIIKKALGHELTHANDKKVLKEFPAGFNPKQYRQEFANAGLTFERFLYACTSPREFIAVASEGSISKYSEGFKKILKDLGMPEWMFEMDRVLTSDEQKKLDGNLRLFNAVFKDIEKLDNADSDLMQSVEINEADKEAIGRYKALVEKRDSEGLNQAEMNELLGLTMDLSDKGYRFGANSELDFDYNPNSESIPNLNMTKAELRNKLSAMGLSDSAIDDIEYNANRIELELLNAIDNPALLEEYRASVLTAVDKEDIPNKLEVYNLLKASSIPTEVKAKMLGETYNFNLSKIKEQIEYTEAIITYLKEHNAEESLISLYAKLQYDSHGTFSHEMFEQISKYNKELLNSDICFDVQDKDIPAKLEAYNLIKEKGLPQEEVLNILRVANEKNLGNVRLIESQREEVSSNDINRIYRNIDIFDENSLTSLKTNALLLEYYDVISLSQLAPEDLEAKNNILERLKAFKFDKSALVKKANKENYKKLSKQVDILNNIATLEGLSDAHKREIAGLAISGNYNTDVMAILMEAVKDDADLLARNLLESKAEFTKDIFRTKTVEEAKQKAEIYNLIKDLKDPETKLYYMNLVNENNFDALKSEIAKNLPIILKFETARNIRSPQFTETEKQEMNSKIEEIKNILAQQAPEETDNYLRMFNESNTLEAFNAKYNIFKKLADEDKLSHYWLLREVVIQEQADIINNTGIRYHTDGICDKAFAQKYQFLKYFDENMKAQGIASRKSGDDFVSMVAQIESPEQFQRLKILWADTNLSRLSTSDLLSLAKDSNKFNLYQQFFKLDGSITEIEGTEILQGIARGNVTEVTSVAQMLKQTALVKSKEILAGYRAGKERKVYDVQSKEEIYNRLKVTFPNLNIKNIENVSDADMNFLEEYISKYQELTFEQIENAVNNGDIAGLCKKANIIEKFPTDTAFYLAFCKQTEFDRIVSILEKRPEIMTKPYDKDTFVKLVNMSDAEWEALKIPVTERTNPNFNPQQYSREVQELLNSGFTLNLDTWNGIERHRMLQAQNHLGRPTGSGVVRFDGTPLVHANRPVLDLPTPDALIKQLETTGSFTLEIGDVKGLPPIQVKNDKAIVKPNEPTGVQDTDQSINIGETRIWDNHRLARDLLQNFYDGNGHTMEGVSISVEKRGNKYAVKIGGRGIFDYDRVLDFGGGSKGGQSKEYVYGIQSGDPESAGHHGEGSKVIAGNLLCTRGSGYVRYASGDWVLTLGVGDNIIIGDNVEKVITKEISKAPERLEGTTYEFETDDIDLVKSILEAKDYFNGPSNTDWATPDIENDYFAIKFLPKGEKGNLYVVQRFEVEGQEGFDGTLDGMTLIFKRQPNDEGLKNNYFKDPYKLEVGRNRVGLTRDDIKSMVHRYAMTLDNESLTKILGNMEESFLFNSDSPNRDIAEAFMWAAFYKGIKIDFGHDKYIATSNSMSARYIQSYGKIPVCENMKYLGIPTSAEFERANENAMMPKMNLTETQTKKLKLLSEAMRIFSSHLDLENSDVISEGNVKKPVYVTEAIVQADENATGEVRAESITDCNGYYGGHWVKESYLNKGDFFDLLATWLHETSHKVDGDGTTPFNERLMKLQELIVNISNADPSFGQQLRILSNEFDKLSGKNVADVTVTQNNLNEIESHISQLLRAAVEKTPATTSENVDVAPPSPQPATSTNIFKRLYQKFYNKLWGTHNQKIDPYIRAESPSFGVKDTPSITEATQPQRVKDPRLTTYESPATVVVSSQLTSTAATTERNLQILEQNGNISIQIPIRGKFNPKISDSSILPNDRKNLGITQNSSLRLDYNNAQEWTREIIARDLFQNFYDGHNGTLDGVSVEIQEVNGKYKIKISGQSEYNYFYLKTIGASDKTDDPRKAGGFGEGAKMASKTLLGEGLVDKISFASGDWTMDFTREEGVPRENNPHLARTLYENTNRVNGTYVEFETSDKGLVEAILRGKDYFKSSENSDFTRIQENGIENDEFGFTVLPEDEKGNLYYIQRYAIKKDGQLEGALNGLSIIFKRQLSNEEKQRFGLADDPDRKGFTSLDIQKITDAMARTMTKEQLIKSVEQLERFWTFTNDTDIDAAMKGKLELTPEQSFAKSMAKAASHKYIEFDSEDLKMVAVDKGDNAYDIQRLQKMGYKIVFDYMKNLGIPSVKEVISKLDNVSDIKISDVEKQKIALLKDAFESGLKVEINLFDAEPNENKVRGIVNDWGEIQYIAIDRKALSEMNFNTLYTQILIQYNFSKKAEQWGYNMTHMIAKQLNLSKDPLYMERFNALAKTFNELKE